MKSSTRQIDSIKAAMIGPMTQTIPASSVFLLTLTSEFSAGIFGLGRRGGSPGGTSRISNASGSENGLDVKRCCKNTPVYYVKFKIKIKRIIIIHY